MERDKKIQKAINTFNSMCCMLIYEDKIELNNTIDLLKKEVEELKL